MLIDFSCCGRLSEGVPRRVRNLKGQNDANTPNQVGISVELLRVLLRDIKFSRQGLSISEAGHYFTYSSIPHPGAELHVDIHILLVPFFYKTNQIVF